MKKLIILLAVLFVLGSFGVFATGAADDDTTTMTGDAEWDWQEDTSPVTLSVYSDRGWWQVWDSAKDQRITDKTGVKWDSRKPVSDEDRESITIMIASNDWPDLMVINSSNSTLSELFDAKLMWDVNELIDKHAPKFRPYLDKFVGTEILGGSFAHTDGVTYQLASGGQTTQKVRDGLKATNFAIPCWLPRFRIMTDIWEELGRPMPTNADEFMDLCDKIAVKYPDKFVILGDKNTKSSWFTYYFGTDHTWQNLSEVNGKIVHYTATEAFEKAIVFMNELARKGYYPKEALVWGAEVEQNLVAGNVAIAMQNGCGYDYENNEGTPFGEMGLTQTPLPYWDTYAYTLYITPWMTDLFPKASDKSDRAIRFIEYAASPEGYVDFYRGVEGSAFGNLEDGPHFSYRPDIFTNDFFPDGFPIAFPELAEANADPAQRTLMDLNGPPFYAIDSMAPGGMFWPGPNKSDEILQNQMRPVFSARPEMYIPIPGDSDEGIIRQKINSLFDDMFAQMVFAESADECLALLAEFKTKSKQLGSDKLERLANEIYQENRKKAGL